MTLRDDTHSEAEALAIVYERHFVRLPAAPLWRHSPAGKLIAITVYANIAIRCSLLFSFSKSDCTQLYELGIRLRGVRRRRAENLFSEEQGRRGGGRARQKRAAIEACGKIKRFHGVPHPLWRLLIVISLAAFIFSALLSLVIMAFFCKAMRRPGDLTENEENLAGLIVIIIVMMFLDRQR